MNKNIVIACGLGDLFTFLTRLDDFFEKNEEYVSVKFWTWLHSPDLAKELVGLSEHNVSIYTLEDMTNFLLEVIPPSNHEAASKLFVKQNMFGAGVDKYMEFIGRFFPNIEQWVYLPVYEKYKSTFPYQLPGVTPAKRDKPYIVVHPYSTRVSTEKPERKWTPKRWGGLLTLMRDHYPEYDIILIGSEMDKIEAIRDFPNGLVDLRGKTTLTEAIALIYGAKAVAGTNSWSTLASLWANIPTYEQWFVQHQLIPSHHPKPVERMRNVFVQKQKTEEQVRVNEAWENMREFFNATIIV